MRLTPSNRVVLRLAAGAAAAITVLPALPAAAAGRPGTLPTPPTRAVDVACPADRVDGPTFSDVDGSAHGEAIRCLAWYGIAQGGVDGGYDPGRAVTRAQMATFLSRVLTAAGVELPAAAPDAFRDDEGNTHEANLDALAALDIVRGGGDGTVDPDAPVRRDQMASFLTRLLEELAAEDEELAEVVEDFFEDDDDNVHQGAINALAGLGIAAGRARGIFDPRSEVLREQMASFLMRLVDRLVEDGDVRVPATLRLAAEDVAPGDVVQAVVLGEDVTSVALSGCGFDGEMSDADPETDGWQFSLTVPDSWPAAADPSGDTEDVASDECEFEVVVTFADGTSQTLDGELVLADAEGDDSL